MAAVNPVTDHQSSHLLTFFVNSSRRRSNAHEADAPQGPAPLWALLPCGRFSPVGAPPLWALLPCGRFSPVGASPLWASSDDERGDGNHTDNERTGDERSDDGSTQNQSIDNDGSDSERSDDESSNHEILFVVNYNEFGSVQH
ncbi:hypothetical protein ACJ73_05158 [Blastomyces percursus]|uniref:Uncharacterized protein n=1 Tax=Blastomyces percursus TaxID=1658174 RepID=A0A1J9R650_9EURO|nr:hypothetical protein ACJ73_05158 [Blastomyces percursus]